MLLPWCSIKIWKTLSGLTSNAAFRKFGKHLQKRQLDIPEYAASFVNYKALKKVEEVVLFMISYCWHWSSLSSNWVLHQLCSLKMQQILPQIYWIHKLHSKQTRRLSSSGWYEYSLVWEPSTKAYSHCGLGTRARESQCILPSQGGRGLLCSDACSEQTAESHIAQAPSQDASGQEESDASTKRNSLKDIRKLRHTWRRLPAVWEWSE